MMAIVMVPTGAGASDVDLGSPATLDELLDSPEYIEDEHGDVARLYQAFLARTPDVGGLVYWIDVYEDGATMTDLAWSFAASTEFTTAYGSSLTNARFLEIVYVNVLGRGYDQAGFDYWLGEMAGGLSRPETVLWIVAGDEFRVNYPFASTAPDTTAALLTASDVPPEFTEHDQQRYELTEADLAAETACVRYRILHTNTYAVFHGRSDGGEFIIQETYAFSNEADAIAAVADHRRVPQECASERTSFVDGSSRLDTYSLSRSTLGIGDESLALNARWDWGTGNAVYDFTLHVVRNGNVVTVTDVTSVHGLPADSFGAGLAQLTSDRMAALLD